MAEVAALDPAFGAPPYMPQDAVGRATADAQRLAWRLLFSLLGWDAHARFGETDLADCQRGKAAAAWPALIGAMDALAVAAPFSAEDGAAKDARLQDWLDARTSRAPPFEDNPIVGAAVVASAVSAHLRAANAEGATRRDRVDALTRAFGAWPGLCRAIGRLSERYAFAAERAHG